MHMDLWEDENNPKNIGCIWNLQQALLEHAKQVFWIIDISTIWAIESIFSNMLFKDCIYMCIFGVQGEGQDGGEQNMLFNGKFHC